MEPVLTAGFLHLAASLHKQGLNFDEISVQLRQQGAPENLLQDIFQQVKDRHFAKKRNTGFWCCGIGVFLIVFGCLLSLFLYSSGNIRLAMYGLTSIGVVFTMKGLIDILGW
jgi:hypothetical protein